MPNDQKLMRRRAKIQKGGECWKCSLLGLSCHRGSHRSGDCIPCGNASGMYSPETFEWFFNEDLGSHLLSLLQSPRDSLLTPDENMLDINIKSSNGLSDSQIHCTESELCQLIPLDSDLKRRFDRTVWKSYIPHIHSQGATTGLIKSALFARGYLSMLLSCNVMEEAESLSNTIHLFTFVVARLDESIGEVASAFSKHTDGDERYWLEAGSSLTILYDGLLHAQDCLEKQTIQPFCGRDKLADLLAGRIESTLAHFTHLFGHPKLICDRQWASILEGSPEDLRSVVKVCSLSISTMKRAVPISTKSLSLSSFGSSSFINPTTPLSSMELMPSGDPDPVLPDTWIGDRWPGTDQPWSSIVTLPTSPWNHFRGSRFLNFIPPQPNIPLGQKIFSPPSTFPYGYTLGMLKPPILPKICTSPQNGYGDFESPEPVTRVQVCELEHIPSHVSLPLPYTYGNGEETSVWDCRDLFPDLPSTNVSSEIPLRNAGSTALGHTLLHIACTPFNALEVQNHPDIINNSVYETRNRAEE